MRVLEVYPWGHGLGTAFRERGHYVLTVDCRPRKVTAEPVEGVVPYGRLRDLGSDDTVPMADLDWDVVLLRPPCVTYSPASFFMHYHDHKTGEPLTDKAREADGIVRDMLALVQARPPRLGWVLENPHGDLRKCSFMQGLPVVTVTLCQYGHACRKATDLFGALPPGFVPKACKAGSDCHLHSQWVRETTPTRPKPRAVYGDALRKTYGTPLERATLPYKLSLALCEAYERQESSRSHCAIGDGR